MNKWIWIIISILIVIIVGYLGVKAYCHYLELNVAYKNPIIKYNKKTNSHSTIVLNSKTDVHFDRADKFTLTPQGGYILDNPVNISFTNSTSSTTMSNSTSTDNGTSKPILPPQSTHDWIVALNYTHLNGQADIQSLTCYKHIIWGFYAGIGIYTRMDMFAEDYVPKYHWQNITVGIAYIF